VSSRLSERGTKDCGSGLIGGRDADFETAGTRPYRSRTNAIDHENSKRNGIWDGQCLPRREAVQQWHFPQAREARPAARPPLAYKASQGCLENVLARGRVSNFFAHHDELLSPHQR
jgi:hypothetical protein